MRATRLLTSTYTNVLGSYDKLNLIFSFFPKANSPKANSASRLRIACAVAVLVSLFMGMGLSTADSTSMDSIDPKTYIRFHYSIKEGSCLIRLYGKESAFKRDAIGNLSSPSKSYVYGIPQLKNPIIKDLSANRQIDYGMKYIKHRYETPCRAWSHWQQKGWH
jgi:hypothetical protein